MYEATIYLNTGNNIIEGKIYIENIESSKTLPGLLRELNTKSKFADILIKHRDSEIIKYAGEDEDRWSKVSKVYFNFIYKRYSNKLHKLDDNIVIEHPMFTLNDLPKVGVNKLSDKILNKASNDIIYGLLINKYTRVNVIGMRMLLDLLYSKYPTDNIKRLINKYDNITYGNGRSSRRKDITKLLRREGIMTQDPFGDILVIIKTITKKSCLTCHTLKEFYNDQDRNVTYDTSYKDKFNVSRESMTIPIYTSSNGRKLRETPVTVTFNRQEFMDDIIAGKFFNFKALNRYTLDDIYSKCFRSSEVKPIIKYVGDNSKRWEKLVRYLIVNPIYPDDISKDSISDIIYILNNDKIEINANYTKLLKKYRDEINPELVLKMTDDVLYISYTFELCNPGVMTYMLFKFLSSIFTNNKTYWKKAFVNIVDTSTLLDSYDNWLDEMSNVLDDEHIDLNNIHVSNIVAMLTIEKYVLKRDLSRFNYLSEYLTYIINNVSNKYQRYFRESSSSLSNLTKILKKIK